MASSSSVTERVRRSPTAATAVNRCISVVRGERCPNPTAHIETRYCNLHRKPCFTSYARVKKTCDQTLEFADLIDQDIDSFKTKEEITQFIQEVHRRYLRVSKCLDIRKLHNDKCVHEEVQDIGHQHHVEQLQSIRMQYDNVLQNAYSALNRMSVVESQSSSSSSSSFAMSTQQAVGPSAEDKIAESTFDDSLSKYDGEGDRHKSALSSLPLSSERQAEIRRAQVIKDIQLEQNMKRWSEEQEAYELQKSLLLAEFDDMIAATMEARVGKGNHNIILDSCIYVSVEQIARTFGKGTPEEMNVLAKIATAWVDPLLSDWVYPLKYFEYFCNMHGCKSYMTVLLSQPDFTTRDVSIFMDLVARLLNSLRRHDGVMMTYRYLWQEGVTYMQEQDDNLNHVVRILSSTPSSVSPPSSESSLVPIQERVADCFYVCFNKSGRTLIIVESINFFMGVVYSYMADTIKLPTLQGFRPILKTMALDKYPTKYHNYPTDLALSKLRRTWNNPTCGLPPIVQKLEQNGGGSVSPSQANRLSDEIVNIFKSLLSGREYDERTKHMLHTIILELMYHYRKQVKIAQYKQLQEQQQQRLIESQENISSPMAKLSLGK